MRHLKRGRKLGRNAPHRLALMRNLAAALIQHERIVTTVAKAKELRPFVEKLITLGRRGDLHARRLATARMGPVADRRVNPSAGDDSDDRTVIQKLFADIGPRFKERPGGYTRIVKRTQRRLGDGGVTAYIELLKEGETKVFAHPPAPKVEEPPAPQPQQETPPAPESSAPPSETPPQQQPETPPAEGGQAPPPEQGQAGEQPKT
jgi:large subunit ribosomal protein L17